VRSVFAIAYATAIEARRNRIAWSLLFFCLVMVLTSFLFQEVTIAAFDRIVRDIGIGAINLFGVLLGAFLGVGVVGRDVDRRIVYVMVAKPITRFQYLFGRALGVWASVAFSLGLMASAFFVECLIYRGPIKLVMFEGLFLILIEVLVVVSIAVMSSSALGSLMAAFVTVSLYVICHFSEDLYFSGRRSAVAAARYLAAGLFYALPNLDRLNLKSEVSALTEVPLARVGSAAAYGLLYSVFFLAIAAVLFQRRDLK
jgi:Cu-processing system permease protein